uniref:Uncharacterized protein n=1 Tax=Glossina brevipalpis TaxID=37001 RepID=A0A1A9WM57_9MUSC
MFATTGCLIPFISDNSHAERYASKLFDRPPDAMPVPTSTYVSVIGTLWETIDTISWYGQVFVFFRTKSISGSCSFAGDCGKTCLLIVFSKEQLTHNYAAAIEVDGEQMELVLWNTAGQENDEKN